MKRVISLLLSLCVIFVALPVVSSAETLVYEGFEYSVTNFVYDECTIKGYTGVGGDVVIPSHIDGYPVTCVSQEAFRRNESITSLTFPDTVYDVGDFIDCPNLKTLNLPANLESMPQLYSDALESVYIPAKTFGISYSTFENCPSLKEITVSEFNEEYKSVDGVLYSADMSALHCYPRAREATRFDIPEGVENMFGGSYDVFYGCNNLQSVTFPDSFTGVYSSIFNDTSIYNNEANWIDGVLYVGDWLITIDVNYFEEKGYKNFTVKDGVRGIARGAFGNWRFDSLTLPEGLEVLNDLNIQDEDISGFDFPSTLKAIDGDIFYNNEVTHITIPEGVEYLGEEAFYGAYGITSITLPRTLKKVYSGLYSSTFMYLELDSIGLPDSLEDIGYGNPFSYSSITEITIPGSVKKIGAFGGTDYVKKLTFKEGVTEIESFYLNEFPALEEIDFPDSLENIGIYDVQYSEYYNNESNWVDGLLYLDNILVAAKPDISGTVKIKDGTTIISDNAFYECEALEEVIIPKSVKKIGECAFFSCSSLKKVSMTDNVKYIGPNAFYGTAITSITIPSGLETIEPAAFCGTKLVNVTIPDGVYAIGMNAFAECSELKTVKIPDSVKVIEDYAFYEVSDSFVMPDLPDDMVKIGYYAFDDSCEGLETVDGIVYYKNYALRYAPYKTDDETKIKIREGTTLISDRIFYADEDVAELELPDSLQYIGYENFVEYESLGSVEMPKGLKSIGDECFASCHSLEEVVFHNELNYMGYGVLRNCRNLESITLPDSVAEITYYNYMYESIVFGVGNTVVYGYSDSYVEKFSDEFGMNFEAIGDVITSPSTGITAAVAYDSRLSDAVFITELKTSDENEVVYDIRFEMDGEEVAPDMEVVVKIPLPDGFDPDKCRIIHTDDDGTKTNMNAVYANGYFIFKTDSFSEYSVVMQTVIYGDINGDEKVTAADALLVLQKAVGKITLDEALLEAADVDGKAGVTASDALLVLQRAVGKIPSFPVEN